MFFTSFGWNSAAPRPQPIARTEALAPALISLLTLICSLPSVVLCVVNETVDATIL
jgi:hypothetical protein